MVDLDSDPAKTSWEKAIQLFHHHKTQVATATWGIMTLETFRRYLSAVKDRGKLVLIFDTLPLRSNKLTKRN